MNQLMIKNKIVTIEAELRLLKSAVYSGPIDYEADDKVWKTVKPILKRVRSQLYREKYA